MPALCNDEVIHELSFQQLRRECKKADLSAAGTTEELRMRLQDWVVNQGMTDKEENQGEKRGRKADKDDEDEGESKKRPKKSPADDLTCPITLELPFEPVSADDGRIYEKDAIEEHIKTQREKGAILRSPVTNKPMSGRLVPLLQHKSLIETLVENGAIQGILVTAWNNRVKQAKKMEELQQKANAGDVKAIHLLGTNYRDGLDGFKEDDELAFQWLQMGHDGGCIKSTALVGEAFFYGNGVEKCTHRGLMYITMAAAQGSDFAASVLGDILADGNGVPQDKKEAIRWLMKSLSPDCPLRHMSQEMEDMSKAKLEEVLNEHAAGAEGPGN